MNLTAILDAMEKKTNEIYEADADYHAEGKRGYYVVEVKNGKVPGQWDAASRPYGAVTHEPVKQDGITINSGWNYEGTVRGKIAYARRTGKDSGADYWQIADGESYWKGAVYSKDGNCICAFSGLKSGHDVEIARAGIAEYDRQRG